MRYRYFFAENLDLHLVPRIEKEGYPRHRCIQGTVVNRTYHSLNAIGDHLEKRLQSL